MKTMKTLALLLLAVAAGSGARAQSMMTLSPGKSYTFTATAASGTGTITYQWLRDGQPIIGATGQNYTLPDYLAQGFNVEFIRTATSSTCSNVTGSTNSYIITFCDLKISNLCWASTNVNARGVFALTAAFHSQFYQWNRLTAWIGLGAVSNWPTNVDQATAWSVNPCPDGWRLPTLNEFEALLSASSSANGTWAGAQTKGNMVPGSFFGPNSASCTLPNNMTNCIFLPANGFRGNTDGLLSSQDSYGYYWSSTQSNTNSGYTLYISNGSASTHATMAKGYGLSIRCVQ